MRDKVGNFYADANAAGYLGWDLLIDYDRAQDVPGVMLGGRPPYLALDCGTIAEPDWQWSSAADAELVLPMKEGPPSMDRLRQILEKRLARSGYEIQAFQFGESTNGWHLKIRLNEHPAPVEAVALQAICGSDPSRESCNIQRAREVERWARDAERDGSDVAHAAAEFWRTRWNVLYQPNPKRKRKP